MKGFYSRDKRKQFEERLKLEQEKYEQDLQESRLKKAKLSIGIQNLREHSKLLEAQKRLKALQKEQESRLNQKDHRDRYVNYLRKNRFSKENSNTIQALDLDIVSKIPKPSQDKKPQLFPVEDSKIPKFSKVSKVALPAIPEKPDNLPWKKGDLLDSLDLSSTNLKKFFHNKPKLCESPGRQASDDRSWLKENFRESIKEWAPRKTWNEKKAEDRLEDGGYVEKIPQVKEINENKKGVNEKPASVKENIENNEKTGNLKPTKRLVPRNVSKAGFNEKLEELKEINRPDKKVKFLIEKNPEKASTRYTNSDIEEEAPSELGSHFNDLKKDPVKQTSPNPTQENHQNKELHAKPPIKKPSKFVTKLKTLEKDTFLENELKCLNDEETRLEASLARLDLKSLKLKHQNELELLNQQAKNLEESLKRAQELPKHPVFSQEESFSEIEDETYKFQGSGSNSYSSPAVSPRPGPVGARVKINCFGENLSNQAKIAVFPEHENKNPASIKKNQPDFKILTEKAKDEQKSAPIKPKPSGYSKQVQSKCKGIPDDQASVAPSDRSGLSAARDPAPEPRARSVASGYSGRSGHAAVRVRVQAASPLNEKHEKPGFKVQEIVKVNPNIDLKSIFGDLGSP